MKRSIRFLAKLDEDNKFSKAQFDEDRHLIPNFRQGGFAVEGEAAMRSVPFQLSEYKTIMGCYVSSPNMPSLQSRC